MADQARQSYKELSSSFPAGCSFFVAAMVLVFTLLPDLNSIVTAYGLNSANGAIQDAQSRSKIDNEKYNEVISYAKTLGGIVVSPGDPTIALYATGRPGRSIYAEFDSLGWPTKLPDFLMTEWSHADYIVTDEWWDWWPSQGGEGLQRRFELEWSNGQYRIWRKSSDK
jgi:hypothetical protein